VTELRFAMPGEPGPYQLWVWLDDPSGKTCSVNFLDYAVNGPAPAVFEAAPKGLRMRFSPGTFESAAGFDTVAYLAGRPALTRGHGTGWLEYVLPLPTGLSPETICGLQLTFEAAPDPDVSIQTTLGLETPTDLHLSLNGLPLTPPAGLTLPTLSQHTGGLLTRLNELGVGEHGQCCQVSLAAENLPALRIALAAERLMRLRFEVPPQAPYPGGLIVFGRQSGRYGIDPTLILETTTPWRS
jgi:hypothetical protein